MALEVQNLLMLRSWSWRLTRSLRITPAKLRERLRLMRAARFVRRSRLFDAKFYLERNPDVVAVGVDPVWHYLVWGASEGRDPHPNFDTSFYLERNPDVAGASVNPLVHYLAHGAAEGRSTREARNTPPCEARGAPSRPSDGVVAREASSGDERTRRSAVGTPAAPAHGSSPNLLNDQGPLAHGTSLGVKQPVAGAKPMRSVSFNARDGNRYWWHRLPTSSYVPPIYALLSDDEWRLMDDWFTETDQLYGQETGECNVPAMCMLQGLIMGSGITRIVQCGHYVGYSTLLIGFMLRRMNRARGLLSIDIDSTATEYTAKWVAKAGLDEQVSLVVSDSANTDLPGVVRQHFRHRDPQLVFIDSSHQYEHTLAELDLWYRILMPGGLILLHDMSRFAARFDSTGRGGVFRAVSEWSVVNGATMLALGGFIDGSSQEHAYGDGCGLGVIQKAAPRGV